MGADSQALGKSSGKAVYHFIALRTFCPLVEEHFSLRKVSQGSAVFHILSIRVIVGIQRNTPECTVELRNRFSGKTRNPKLTEELGHFSIFQTVPPLIASSLRQENFGHCPISSDFLPLEIV